MAEVDSAEAGTEVDSIEVLGTVVAEVDEFEAGIGNDTVIIMCNYIIHV